MKNYSILTSMISLPTPIQPGLPISFIVTLPDNAIPFVQVEHLPADAPPGYLVNYLVPCDESGNPIEEVITPNVYEMAWDELYKLYSEQLNQEELDIMDAVLRGVIAEIKDEAERRGAEGKEE